MNYTRFLSSRSTASSVPDNPPPAQDQTTGNHGSKRRRRLLLVGLFAAILLVACGLSVAFIVRNHAGESALPKPSQAISRACGMTRYPSLCVSSLMDFPGAMDAAEADLVHISVNMTLQRVGSALDNASAIANVQMERLAREAYGDCLELLDDSVDHLSRSLAAVYPGAGVQRGADASDADVLTWLSGALTNHDTCAEGLDEVTDAYVKNEMAACLKDLSELVSNCLAIFAASKNNDFSGIPIQNRRRRLLGSDMPTHDTTAGLFPSWLSKKDRRLLEMPASTIQADMVVSMEGNGTYRTIDEAVKAAPEHSSRRIIIYVKAGRYQENIKVGRKKTNLMFVGDGKGKTIITSSRNVFERFTTFRTATFAATGAGFIARDMTFENTAGPAKHQAVALRVGADHAVVYRCGVLGYQDTLYVHSLRQFFRECDVYGTVDFIFGNAAVVLQSCIIYARRPMDTQKNTITAQNRKDPNQNTGISIHDCRIVPASDLEGNTARFHTYLGRPWKLYARTVYMLSYMAGHIDPAGWLEWNGNFALDTLYYGEYMNYGPGAGVGKRVTWPGYRVITLSEEASKFTVAQFIYGSSWLPATGVAFVAGLRE